MGTVVGQWWWLHHAVQNSEADTLKCVRILRTTAVTLKCISCNSQTVRDFWLGAYCAKITNYLAILEHYC